MTYTRPYAAKRNWLLLSVVIRNGARADDDRIQAMGLIWQMQGQRYRTATGELLWQTYAQSSEPPIRKAALQNLAHAKQTLPEECRVRLYADAQGSPPDLKNLILRSWSVWFPAAPPPSGSSSE